jgi:hypothetical protein
MIEKFKNWRLRLIKKLSQSYADTIIIKLSNSRGDWEFNFWMNQGLMLDDKMIEKYNIYLD